MSLVLIANRLGAHAWDHGPLVAAIAHELAARGLPPTLIADSVEDPAAFAGVALHAFRPYEQTATAFPIRFPRWASRRAAGINANEVISLTHRVAAAKWVPLDRTRPAWLAHQASTRGPISLAATLARTPGAFISTRGRLAPHAASVALPPCTLLVEPQRGEREHARAAIRSLLRIPETHTLLLVSAPEAIGSRFDPIFAALSRHSSMHTLAILARDTFTSQRRASQIGGPSLLDRLRILTLTQNVRPLLLATDHALVFPSTLDRFAHDARSLKTSTIDATRHDLLEALAGADSSQASNHAAGIRAAPVADLASPPPLSVAALVEWMTSPAASSRPTIARP